MNKTIRKTLVALLLPAAALTARAQLTIDSCYAMARANYPLIARYGLIEKTRQYNLENAAKGYLPQVALTAQASWQSDVTDIPIDTRRLGLAGVALPEMKRDQYRLAVDVNQTLWDGGNIRSEQAVERTRAEAESRSLDVELYALNGRVNQLFFGLLLTDGRLSQNRLLQQELTRHCREVENLMAGGVANRSDLDALRVDLLKARQDEAALRQTRRAYATMLGRLTGQAVTDTTTLVRPAAVRPAAGNSRPELALLDARARNVEARNERIRAGLMPQLGLFVTGGVGRPGLDMFEDDFRVYFTAGLRLSWNLSLLYTRRADRAKLRLDLDDIEARRRTFLFDTDVDAALRSSTIDRYEEQLRYDDEIVALRTAVKEASAAKLAGGTLRGTDLARDINAEQAARQDRLVHEIELLAAIYDLKYLTNR